MNPFEMVVLIVGIVMIASIAKAKYGHAQPHRRDEDGNFPPAGQAENIRLREEVSELKERITVIERITVEKENSLARQIDELRDR